MEKTVPRLKAAVEQCYQTRRSMAARGKRRSSCPQPMAVMHTNQHPESNRAAGPRGSARQHA